MKKPFLHTEWRKLIMINYEVDPEVLLAHLPYGTELDSWNGKYYVSIVGFKFLNTKVRGIKFPFHINFEQVNFRFYVKRKINNETRHGVVFIKEIVDKPVVKWMANTLYKENYVRLPMGHHWNKEDDQWNINYRWKFKNKWNNIEVVAKDQLMDSENGSEEKFIAEHYWGYIKIDEKKAYEFRVEHSPWAIYPINHFNIDIDFVPVYGKNFEFLQSQKPSSVFLAEGSEVFLGDRSLMV